MNTPRSIHPAIRVYSEPVKKGTHRWAFIDDSGEYIHKQSEDKQDLDLLGTCYLCHRKSGSQSMFVEVIESPTAPEILELVDRFDVSIEALMTQKSIHIKARAPFNCCPMRIPFAHGARTAVYPICFECQLLLGVPMDQGAPGKEENMSKHIIMTGRTIEDGVKYNGPCCYLCGRREGEDSLSFVEHYSGNKMQKEEVRVRVSLKKVTRVAVKDRPALYYLCQECNAILGLPDNLVLTEDGEPINPEGSAPRENQRALPERSVADVMSNISDHLDRFSDLSNIDKGMPGEEFIRGASSVIASVGPDIFLQQLLASYQRKQKRRKK